MRALLLHLLRLIGAAVVFVFGTVTLSLILALEINFILSGLITLIGVAIMWWTTKRLRKIRETKEEERRRLMPQQYAVIAITEEEEAQMERVEDITDQLFAVGNVSISYVYTVDAVRSILPSLQADQFPYFVIAKESPTDDMDEMFSQIQVHSSDPAVLLRFLKDEMEKHERNVQKNEHAM